MTTMPHQASSKNDTTAKPTDGRVDPIVIGDTAEITDAFIDFNIGFGNPPELVVMTSRKVKREFAYPVSGDEDTDVMLGETDEGLFFGWQNSPAHPPADTSPVTKEEPVTHETAGVIDRVPMFDHIVKNKQNDRENGSVLSVTYKYEYPTSIPTRVEFAQEVIDTYVNGPLGTPTVSYWAHRKGPHGLDDKYDPYLDCDVVITEEPIFTWAPERATDVSDADTVFTA